MGLYARRRPGLHSGAQSRHICHLCRVLDERVTEGVTEEGEKKVEEGADKGDELRAGHRYGR